jgi:aldose 1-epimerase
MDNKIETLHHNNGFSNNSINGSFLSIIDSGKGYSRDCSDKKCEATNISEVLDLQRENAAKDDEEDLSEDVVLTEDIFETYQDEATGISQTIKRYTWTTKKHLKLQVITFGARVVRLEIPDHDGVPEDIVLGSDKIEDYFHADYIHSGAIIGRTSGPIKNAEFCINGDIYELHKEKDGKSQKNGGVHNFSTVNWKPFVDGKDLVLSWVSRHMHEGYPGNVMVSCRFHVSASNELHVTLKATSDRITPIDLSQRLEFNLAGHRQGYSSLYKQNIQLSADHYFSNNGELPDRRCTHVSNTSFDLQTPVELGYAMFKTAEKGFQNYYKLSPTQDNLGMNFVCRLIDPICHRFLEMYTNQQYVYLDTCNAFPDPTKNIAPHYPIPFPQTVLNEIVETVANINFNFNGAEENEKNFIDLDQCVISEKTEPMTIASTREDLITKPFDGKDHTKYYKNQGIFMQPQNHPHAVRHSKKHPSILLIPGKVYNHKIIYKFGVHIGPVHETSLDD